jgi:hypothetical protein
MDPTCLIILHFVLIATIPLTTMEACPVRRYSLLEEPQIGYRIQTGVRIHMEEEMQVVWIQEERILTRATRTTSFPVQIVMNPMEALIVY